MLMELPAVVLVEMGCSSAAAVATRHPLACA